MREKFMSDIKLIMQNSSGQLIDVLENKLDDWLKSQLEYKPPKPTTNLEKIERLAPRKYKLY